jgi:DNA-binding NtrC family response regulator
MSISRSAPSFIAIPPSRIRTTEMDQSGFDLVGTSAAMERVRLQMRRIGPHFRTVLVRGEAGTGKELVARELHTMGRASDGPFVVCRTAMVEDDRAQRGANAESVDALERLWKMAEPGTVFLDDFGQMPLEAQDRLLQALRAHESAQRRMEAPQRTGLRLIAASAEDLRVKVSTGRFRQELYQRFATTDILLPPLRERIEDIPELARCFLGRFEQLYGKSVRAIADEAMERMKLHRWPGNVRELESVLRNAVLRCDGGVLEPQHLPVFAEATGQEQSTIVSGDPARLQDVVEQHVLRVLKECGGNKLRAAEVLGISRSTLYRMLGAGAPLATVD